MHLKLLAACLALAVCTLPLRTVQSYRILAVYAFPGKSHFMMHTALIRELIRRGHHVTMITAFTLEHLHLGSNYTEILIEPVYDFWRDVKEAFKAENIFEFTDMDEFGFLKMLEVIGTKTTEHALKQTRVQELINATETEDVYDLLLAEQFYQEPFLALAYKYGIPVVTSGTLDYQNFMSQMMGFITPWSFVPHGFLPFTDHMSFAERVLNTYFSFCEYMIREFVYFPKMDALVRRYFGHLPIEIPKVSVMEKNISVMLLNSHVPLTTARPFMNGMIPVGGMHIYPPAPLPHDIQHFLDGTDHGAIYFSLGSNVQSQDMPIEKLEMFLKVFAKMKVRVLWKFENETLPHLPANVMVKSWLPQRDILAHRNVKIFITHGGLFSTQEGVYYAVPMLGFPVYCDQHLNMNKGVKGGYAISLYFQSVTEEVLENALRELLHNPFYKENIQHVSRIFRDRPMGARDSAVYWIEYVIRHKGAPQIRSAGLDLKWYQFYLLDVLAFMLGTLLMAVIVVIVTTRWLLGHLRRKSPKEKVH